MTKTVYAFIEQFPKDELIIKSVPPKPNSIIRLLYYEKPLSWTQTDNGIKITLPEELQEIKNRPCEFA
ncbi:MAG: hypothetical protein LBF88_13155 [Planctomycetaceae bacterium]|nr:hypothetical protein [Planctomycetaceae bacterium]